VDLDHPPVGRARGRRIHARVGESPGQQPHEVRDDEQAEEDPRGAVHVRFDGALSAELPDAEWPAYDVRFPEERCTR
jgi:hypothetical protein